MVETRRDGKSGKKEECLLCQTRKRRKIDGGKIVALFRVFEREENYKLKGLSPVLRGSSASLRPENERAGWVDVSQLARTRQPNLAAEKNISGQRWLTFTHYIHTSSVESPSTHRSLSSHLDDHQVAKPQGSEGERQREK